MLGGAWEAAILLYSMRRDVLVVCLHVLSVRMHLSLHVHVHKRRVLQCGHSQALHTPGHHSRHSRGAAHDDAREHGESQHQQGGDQVERDCGVDGVQVLSPHIGTGGVLAHEVVAERAVLLNAGALVAAAVAGKAFGELVVVVGVTVQGRLGATHDQGRDIAACNAVHQTADDSDDHGKYLHTEFTLEGC